MIPDPVAYYKLDGNSGDYFMVNNGADTNISYVPVKINDGASFNGVNSEIYVAPNATFDFGFGDFSFACWMTLNTGSINKEFGILAKTANYTASPGFFMEAQTFGGSGSNFNILAGISTVGFATVGCPFQLIGTLIHVVFTRSGSTAKLYINGVLTDTVTGPGFLATVTSTQPLIFGNISWGVRNNGLLDEVGFWDKEIYAHQALQLYNSGMGTTVPFKKSGNMFMFF